MGNHLELCANTNSRHNDDGDDGASHRKLVKSFMAHRGAQEEKRSAAAENMRASGLGDVIRHSQQKRHKDRLAELMEIEAIVNSDLSDDDGDEAELHTYLKDAGVSCLDVAFAPVRRGVFVTFCAITGGVGGLPRERRTLTLYRNTGRRVSDRPLLRSYIKILPLLGARVAQR